MMHPFIYIHTSPKCGMSFFGFVCFRLEDLVDDNSLHYKSRLFFALVQRIPKCRTRSGWKQGWTQHENEEPLVALRQASGCPLPSFLVTSASKLQDGSCSITVIIACTMEIWCNRRALLTHVTSTVVLYSPLRQSCGFVLRDTSARKKPIIV